MPRVRVFHAPFVHWHYRRPTYRELAARVRRLVVSYAEEDPGLGTVTNQEPYDCAHVRGRRLFGYGLLWHRCRPRRASERDDPTDVFLLEWNVRNAALWWDTLLLRIAGRPVIWWGHGLAKDAGVVSMTLLRLARLLPNRVLVYSKTGKQGLVEKAGFDPARVDVAPNGLPVGPLQEPLSGARRAGALRSELGIDSASEETFVSIYCGRLEPGRDLDRIVRAVATLADGEHDWVHVFVGDGAAREPLEALANELGVSHRVVFVGAVFDRAKLAGIYGLVDLCVIPGWLGLVLTQASSFGVPSVVCDDPRLHNPEIEAHRPGETGWVYDHEANRLDVAIAEVISGGRTACRQAGRQAHHVVATEYSTESMVDGIVDSISKVA